MTKLEHLQNKWGHNLGVAGAITGHVIRHIDTVVAWGAEPAIASIDVTPNCNLRCQPCYLFGKPHQKEGTEDAEFLTRVHEFRKQHPELIHCTWVGGEPLWRKDLLRNAVKSFPLNWVVTNGTIPIDGAWPNATAFFVSIDGIREVHNSIRKIWKESGSDYSVYDRAKSNANAATATVCVHTVVNHVNKDCIPELVKEWKNDTKARGFTFSLHTPTIERSDNDRELSLNPKERLGVVKMLLQLKKEYGDYILLSEEQIKDLLPERQSLVFGKNCPLPRLVISLDSTFERKLPCVMGPGMDCNECGCTVSPLVDRVLRLDLGTIRLNLDTFFV